MSEQTLTVMTKTKYATLLKRARKELDNINKEVKRISLRANKKFVKTLIYSNRDIQHLMATQRKAHQRLTGAHERIECVTREITELRLIKDACQREIQKLEEGYNRAVSDEEKEEVSDEEKEEAPSATLMVRMLSGDVKAVKINMGHSVATFAEVFAQQNGYNSAAAKTRMVFLIHSEEEEKENKVFWSPEEYQWGRTYADVFGTGDVLPMIHLLVRPIDYRWDHSILANMIRHILKEQSLNDNYENEQLISMFGDWYLTYQPSSKVHHYMMVRDFVKQNHTAFWPLPEEEVEVRKFREWVTTMANIILTLAAQPVTGAVFLRRRNIAFDSLETAIRDNDIDGIQFYHPYYINHIHPLELHHMGVTPEAHLYTHPTHCNYLKDIAGWLARSGPITLPEAEGIVWRV